MAATKLKVTFANYTHNNTYGITLTNGTSAAFDMHDVLTPTGLSADHKSATSVAATTHTKPQAGDLVVAEPIKSGDTYIVCYFVKDDDAFAIEQPYSAS